MKDHRHDVMVSDIIADKIDIDQLYENTDDDAADLTVSFWTNGYPISSKLQKIKIDSHTLHISFICNSSQAGKFIMTQEVCNLSIFRSDKSESVFEIETAESISRNLKINSEGSYMCELIIRTFNM